MAKKIQAYVKLQIIAGMANPSPPIGPALGQHGINIMEFCKSFNTKTENFEKTLPIPIIVTVYSDRSFTFIIKTSPTVALLKKAAGIQIGSSKPNKDKVGKVTSVQIYEIVKIKSIDMTGINEQAMYRSIIGTAYSMGIIVED